MIYFFLDDDEIIRIHYSNLIVNRLKQIVRD